MNKTSYVLVGVVVLIGILVLYFYIALQSRPFVSIPEPEQPQASTSTAPTEPTAALPNPASVHCVDSMGGTLKIFDTSEGQVGLCHLPDGRWCEEWELYRTNTCTLPATISAAELYGKG